jgi:hypothetical protein
MERKMTGEQDTKPETPRREQNKSLPLEERVDEYKTTLPIDLQQFYKTLPAPYQQALAQVYTAYRAVGIPNPEHEAIKTIGAKLYENVMGIGRYRDVMAEQVLKGFLHNIGYQPTEIEQYFQKTNEKSER